MANHFYMQENYVLLVFIYSIPIRQYWYGTSVSWGRVTPQ